MSFQIILKPLKNRWMIALIVGATCITGVTVYYGFSQIGQTQKEPEQTAIPQVKQVTALGRLQPVGEVIKVSVGATLSNDRVAKLMVNRGDKVLAGDVIAVMNARSRLQNTLNEAQEQVKVSQAELARVKAGAKIGEIGAQKATIVRLKVENTTLESAQRATVNRLQAEKNTETEATLATIARLQFIYHQSHFRDINFANTEQQPKTEPVISACNVNHYFGEAKSSHCVHLLVDRSQDWWNFRTTFSGSARRVIKRMADSLRIADAST